MIRLKCFPALLVVDMQNAFCHPSGSFSKIGLPISRHAAIIPAIRHLKSLCNAHSIPIFYTQMAFNRDYSDAGIVIDSISSTLKNIKALVHSTWDAQIVDDLRPCSRDTLVTKTRNSAFFETNLRRLLRNQGINQIIATGVGTNVCVESTVRDAWAHGIHALTISNATATLNEEEQMASMINLRHFGGTISVEEFEMELKHRPLLPESSNTNDGSTPKIRVGREI